MIVGLSQRFQSRDYVRTYHGGSTWVCVERFNGREAARNRLSTWSHWLETKLCVSSICEIRKTRVNIITMCFLINPIDKQYVLKIVQLVHVYIRIRTHRHVIGTSTSFPFNFDATYYCQTP